MLVPLAAGSAVVIGMLLFGVSTAMILAVIQRLVAQAEQPRIVVEGDTRYVAELLQ
jgi:hypothetical protein